MAGPASSAAAHAGHHEDARPDDAAHAQRGQRHRPQHAVQAVLAAAISASSISKSLRAKMCFQLTERFLGKRPAFSRQWDVG